LQSFGTHYAAYVSPQPQFSPQAAVLLPHRSRQLQFYLFFVVRVLRVGYVGL